MGALLHFLMLVSAIALIGYIIKKRKKVKLRTFIALFLATITTSLLFAWYLAPFKIKVPADVAIKVTWQRYENEILIEDPETYSKIIEILDKIEYRREVSRGNNFFAHWIGSIGEGEYFVMELYPSDMQGRIISEYNFVVAIPEGSRYAHDFPGYSNKYQILNAASVVEELLSIIPPYSS